MQSLIERMGNEVGGKGKAVISSSGRWATNQYLRALNSGKPLDASIFRSASTLPQDSWEQIDEVVTEETGQILAGVADLFAAGLTTTVDEALGVSLFGWDQVSSMDPAISSLDGLDFTDDDAQTYTRKFTPLPITHKGFKISLRDLRSGSRVPGESVVTSRVRNATRLVGEQLENLLFNGGSTYDGNALYGFINLASRNTLSFSGSGNWSQAAADGEVILDDVNRMVQALRDDGYNTGPYWLRIPTIYAQELSKDFKSNSDKSVRTRLLEEVDSVAFSDQIPSHNVILFQATSDVVTMLDGEPVQVIQWDTLGGFQVVFKVMGIQVPLIKWTKAGNSGVAHMS